MNTIPAQEIKRRGISAVDKALQNGPVHVIKNNRPQYVILTEEQYIRLSNGRSNKGSLWDWLARPTRATRTRKEIDTCLREERDNWGDER